MLAFPGTVTFGFQWFTKLLARAVYCTTPHHITQHASAVTRRDRTRWDGPTHLGYVLRVTESARGLRDPEVAKRVLCTHQRISPTRTNAQRPEEGKWRKEYGWNAPRARATPAPCSSRSAPTRPTGCTLPAMHSSATSHYHKEAREGGTQRFPRVYLAAL